VVANSQWVIGGNKYYYARSDIVTRISSWGYYLIYSPAKKESTGKKFQELVGVLHIHAVPNVCTLWMATGVYAINTW